MIIKSSEFLFKNSLNPWIIRNCHTKQEIRVRFAPSPTGFLHLGGLRTALYNYLFSKKHNGKFILRIEDTDQARLVKGSTDKLIEDIKWSGIQIDEGPSFGGSYGPYIQSERLAIYRTEIRKLLENCTAYHCFCPDRRLELLRKEAIRSRQIPKYDNKCRYLTPIQIAKKLSNNEQYCIRFALSSYTKPFNDIVYGKCAYDVSENEGDPVIMKSDGFPTYHFANVVDDHLMKISHVFRGVEWQISTTKHLLIYKAFGWKPPEFGHLPLLINADGTKLSKRQGDIHIKQYRDTGIFPQALVNYVTLAGGGFDRQKTDTLKFYFMDELVTQFNIFNVNSHPSKLNPDLLRDINRLEIIQKMSNEESCKILIDDVKTSLKRAYPKKQEHLDLDAKHIKNILSWAINRITTISELIEKKLSFLWIRPINKIQSNLNNENIKELIAILETCENFEKNNLHDILKNFSSEKNIQFPDLMKNLRKVLSGLDEGPGVAEMMNILGKTTTINRIKFMLT